MALQLGIAVKPQFLGEADDGRPAGARPPGEIRDRAESEQRGLGQDFLRDAPFRRGQITGIP